MPSSDGVFGKKCSFTASGARVSELVRFTTDMIDYDNTAFDGIFLETTSKLKVKGRGVDGKYIERYIIKDIFVPYYEKYLPVKKEIMEKNGKDHNFIFIKKIYKDVTSYKDL